MQPPIPQDNNEDLNLMQRQEGNESLKSLENTSEMALMQREEANSKLDDINRTLELQLEQNNGVQKVKFEQEEVEDDEDKLANTFYKMLRGKRGEKGDKGDKGDQGIQGEKGEPGEDAYTPIKGRDYEDGKDGYTPIKGIDYVDGKDSDPVEVASVLKTDEEFKLSVKGEKGDTPVIDTTKIVNDVAKKVLVKPEKLIEQLKDKLSYNDLKDKPEFFKQSSKTVSLKELDDVDLTNATVTNGKYVIPSNTGGGSPGGSTAQLQYNNAGAFGGISGATTDGTAVTYTANNLKAADITASGSGGFLIQSNSGTDVGLFGAGGGSGATFYGGVNIGGSLTVDTNTLYVDATNNRVGILTTSPAQALHVSSATTYQGIFVNGNAAPNVSFAQSAGTTAEWKAGISGNAGTSFSISSGASNADRLLINSSGFIGLNTNTNPTHTLTLASTSTGIALYNTADQTTNYERMHARWSSNIFLADVVSAGSGTNRAFYLRNTATSGGTADIRIERAASAHITTTSGISSTGETNLRVAPTVTGTNTIPTAMVIAPSVSQSSTAGYTALLVNPTETTTGSGSKLLADFQVGGVSKFNVANTGITTITNTNDATASTQVLILQGDSATPAANDDIYQSFRLSNSAGTQFEFARIAVSAGVVTAASEAASITFSVASSGTLAGELILSGASLRPFTNDGLALGNTSNMFADLFLASGGVINWNNGNATLTHSTGLLTSNVPVASPQVYNADNAITATANAATVTRAFKNNVVTNNSAAGITITLSTTSAAAGDTLIVQSLPSSAVAQTITWVNTENSDVTPSANLNASTTSPRTDGFKWNPLTSKWRCIASC